MIDIGGYIGDSAIFFAIKGAKTVQVYELDIESFKLLKENIRLNKLEDKIIAHNVGVSNETKTQTFYVTTSKSRAGAYATHYLPESHIVKKIQIQLIPFKEIIKDSVDIVKIDCEGCEYEILENIIQDNLFEKIKEEIIIETHHLDPIRSLENARSLLKKIGFKKIYTINKELYKFELLYSRK